MRRGVLDAFSRRHRGQRRVAFPLCLAHDLQIRLGVLAPTNNAFSSSVSASRARPFHVGEPRAFENTVKGDASRVSLFSSERRLDSRYVGQSSHRSSSAESCAPFFGKWREQGDGNERKNAHTLSSDSMLLDHPNVHALTNMDVPATGGGLGQGTEGSSVAAEVGVATGRIPGRTTRTRTIFSTGFHETCPTCTPRGRW